MQEKRKNTACGNFSDEVEYGFKGCCDEEISRLENRCSALSSYISSCKNAEMQRALESDIVKEAILNIPGLPLFISHLTSMYDDGNANFDTVAQEIMQDPNLVALIMKQVNSAQYGLSKKVDSFKLAISLLGFDEVFRLAVKAHALDVLPGSRKLNAMLDHSIAVSRMAYEIGKKIGHPKPSVLSLLGILHDMGKSAVYYMKDRVPLVADFADLLDTDILGAILLEKWGLPPKICQAIRRQNFPAYTPVDNLSRENLCEISALFMAHLCDQHLEGREDVGKQSAYVWEYLEFLGLEECTSIADVVTSIILPQLQKHKWTFTSPV